MIKVAVICSSRRAWAYFTNRRMWTNQNEFESCETIYTLVFSSDVDQADLHKFDRLVFVGILRSEVIQRCLGLWRKPSEPSELDKARQELNTLKTQIEDLTVNLSVVRRDLALTKASEQAQRHIVCEQSARLRTAEADCAAAKEDAKRLAKDYDVIKSDAEYYRRLYESLIPNSKQFAESGVTINALKSELVSTWRRLFEAESKACRIERVLADTVRAKGEAFHKIARICDQHQ
jgi:hypothetical protein